MRRSSSTASASARNIVRAVSSRRASFTSALRSSTQSRRSSTRRMDDSSNRRKLRSSKSTAPPQKTMKINCGGTSKKADILAQISSSVGDVQVTTLLLEDLLSTKKHHSLLPQVESLVFANDRCWKQIEFTDTFELGDRFDAWLEGKAQVIQAYKTTIHQNETEAARRKAMINAQDQRKLGHNEPNSNLRNVISWKARIAIPAGTDLEEFMGFLRDIKDGSHVLDMKVNGGLPSPSKMVNIVDWDTSPAKPMNDKSESEQFKNDPLMKPVVIDLDCGWRTMATPECGPYKKFINVCLCRFKEVKREIRRDLEKLNRPRRSSRRSSAQASMPSLQRAETSESVKKKRSKSFGCTPDGEKLLGEKDMDDMEEMEGRKRSARDRTLQRLEDSWQEEIAPDSRRDKEERRRSSRGNRRSQSFEASNAAPEITKKDRSSMRSARTSTTAAETNNTKENTRPSEVVFSDNGSRGRSASPIGDNDHLETSERSPNTVVVSTEKPTTTEVKKPLPQQQAPKKYYWRSAVDPTTGNTYYYHKKTKETFWEKPSEMIEHERVHGPMPAKAG